MQDNMDMQFVQGCNATDHLESEKKPMLSDGEEILDMGDDRSHSTIAKSMLMQQVFQNFQTPTLCKSSLTGKQRSLH